MVTSVGGSTAGTGEALPGGGFDGVVRLSVGGYYGTGALLYDGRAVLTAAHLFSHGVLTGSVQFDTLAGTQSVGISTVELFPAYDAANENGDLAVVWLNSPAPAGAERYSLYRDGDEIGKTFAMVGYGQSGSGALGVMPGVAGGQARIKASNQFDADMAALKRSLGGAMAWKPLADSQLGADFDDGSSAHDAFGQLMGVSGLGLGAKEGLIANGDSGGPAFINGQIAGVASYAASLATPLAHPDVDSVTNSSFGEIAAWQRVGSYQQWIDQSLRSHYVGAPTKPSEVKTAVAEGNSGTTMAYFLLQFSGMRGDPNQVLSVDYATRDGSARAGMDYLPVSGRLVIYPNETQAVIPVEILADTVAEPDETFYLDVTNPQGGSFGPGIVRLTAMRTIINDDGGLGWV